MNNLPYQAYLDREINQSCINAIHEDLGGKHGIDLTASLIPEKNRAHATLISRDDGVLCGKAWFNKVFEVLDNDIEVKWAFEDGQAFKAGSTLCTLNGNARAILTGERSAMNFLQTLSATATVTQQYSAQIATTNCKLLDTRKTLPGMRFGQKYAVRCGGGENHRIGLFDAFLIKENHIMACGGIKQALATAIKQAPDKLLEIEVENLDELKQALDGKAQVIMLDNFDLNALREAVAIRNDHPSRSKLEASGNLSLDNIRTIAETGVDFISVGALTKHIQALDLSLRINID
ncbi:carboxylating nicotinate-nucleotide diphosphorylase [Aliikangiella marina]|uniref:Probable nicotinate-nucleotide pyrophosphorylase [carboxylating] n=1 Tax=Aliikangiella marina TaxID=1712262 RepID=A0A545T2E2_9GAMM|nr:carboxylating nicotinate-nucleotide diphosphorylase [Aliikangiella marina]TQV71384.1 carboxylating nicotinate-nucleotide diphosphorylase [Aliikangiella marina]